jgi:hypothetical protein
MTDMTQTHDIAQANIDTNLDATLVPAEALGLVAGAAGVRIDPEG